MDCGLCSDCPFGHCEMDLCSKLEIALLSKKNKADPDSQEMRTGAGNHEEALRAKNSYLECVHQAGG